MFKTNKYTNYYYSIIRRAETRIHAHNCSFERHHIIPLSMGGSDENSNLAILTCREHFIVHKLLVKMCKAPRDINKMWFALHRIINNGKYSKTSRDYENIRKHAAIAMSSHLTGITRSAETKEKISKIHKGKTMSKESRSKMSASRIGIPRSEETKAAVAVGIKEMWKKRKAGIIPLPKNAVSEEEKLLRKQEKEKLKHEKLKLRSWAKSEEHKNKIRENMKKRWELIRQGIIQAPKLSDKGRASISKSSSARKHKYWEEQNLLIVTNSSKDGESQ